MIAFEPGMAHNDYRLGYTTPRNRLPEITRWARGLYIRISLSASANQVAWRNPHWKPPEPRCARPRSRCCDIPPRETDRKRTETPGAGASRPHLKETDMGWLSMTRMGMGAYDTPKAYLDAQLTYEHPAADETPFRALRVLKSVYSGSAYYAAAERYDEHDETIDITAVVCLVR